MAALSFVQPVRGGNASGARPRGAKSLALSLGCGGALRREALASPLQSKVAGAGVSEGGVMLHVERGLQRAYALHVALLAHDGCGSYNIVRAVLGRCAIVVTRRFALARAALHVAHLRQHADAGCRRRAKAKEQPAATCIGTCAHETASGVGSMRLGPCGKWAAAAAVRESVRSATQPNPVGKVHGCEHVCVVGCVCVCVCVWH